MEKIGIIVLFLSFVSCNQKGLGPLEEIKSGAPIVTVDASEITISSAILNGYVNPEYLTPGVEVGFFISSSPTINVDQDTKLVSAEIEKNGKFSARIDDLDISTEYYYKAFVNIGSYLVGDVRQFKTMAFVFSAIDIGLNVKWGNANLGANAPYGLGEYYAWGETEPKDTYSWNNYKWCKGSNNSLTKYNSKAEYGIVDNKSVLDSADDAAHVKLGGNWRIPTIEELNTLLATQNSKDYHWEWKTYCGVHGLEIKYLVNGNSIFLPGAGFKSNSSFYNGFWTYSSSSLAFEPFYSAGIQYDFIKSPSRSYGDRSDGLVIRPVKD